MLTILQTPQELVEDDNTQGDPSLLTNPHMSIQINPANQKLDELKEHFISFTAPYLNLSSSFS